MDSGTWHLWILAFLALGVHCGVSQEGFLASVGSSQGALDLELFGMWLCAPSLWGFWVPQMLTCFLWMFNVCLMCKPVGFKAPLLSEFIELPRTLEKLVEKSVWSAGRKGK